MTGTVKHEQQNKTGIVKPHHRIYRSVLRTFTFCLLYHQTHLILYIIVVISWNCAVAYYAG